MFGVWPRESILRGKVQSLWRYSIKDKTKTRSGIPYELRQSVFFCLVTRLSLSFDMAHKPINFWQLMMLYFKPRTDCTAPLTLDHASDSGSISSKWPTPFSLTNF